MNSKFMYIILWCYLSISIGIDSSYAVAPPNPTNSDATGNTAGGTGALANTTGSSNTGFGIAALYTNTTGGDNSAIGSNALASNTTGHSNTAVGSGALANNTTGKYNSAVGILALVQNTTGQDNIALGDNALAGNKTGSHNTATGSEALSFNTTGSNNTGNGSRTLYSNLTGYYNTASGFQALYANRTGKYNTAAGGNALFKNTAGIGNSGFGLQSLYQHTTGNYNLALGFNAGFGLKTGSYNIYLSNNGIANESNTIRIGSNQTRTFVAGIRSRKTGVANAVPVMIDSKGQLGTIKSSARYKRDISDMAEASHKLYQLRPVTYRYKEADDNGANPLEYGLIAEEVAKVYPDLVAYGADGQIETVQYQKLTPMLLNEMQRLAKESANLRDQFNAEQTKNRELQLEVKVLKSQIHLIQTLTTRLERLEAGQMVVQTSK